MIISIVVSVILGCIFGIWLNKQAYDELKQGKKWFKVIIWACATVFLISVAFFRDLEGFESLIGAIFFLATIAYFSYRKTK